MPGSADVGLGNHPRSRAVFIHSRGSQLFLGRTLERNEREVTVEEVEALTSAGFEIVEVNMKEGAPLCAALAVVQEGAPAVMGEHPLNGFVAQRRTPTRSHG
ncbi:MAG TPA: hypothetical protein VMT45_03425 [Thermoanaerobaculaceae bacterium]|nr:hypothetical protein [Thermoanaerobaculaceae bacterium]